MSAPIVIRYRAKKVNGREAPMQIVLGFIIMFLPDTLYGYEAYLTNVNKYQSFQSQYSESVMISKSNYEETFIHRDAFVENTSYFKNGRIKNIIKVYYDNDGLIYEVIEQKFRKSGDIKYVFKLGYGHTILCHAKYAEDNQIIFEKNYTYNFKGTLLKVETKRDGNNRIKTFDVDIFGDPIYCE